MEFRPRRRRLPSYLRPTIAKRLRNHKDPSEILTTEAVDRMANATTTLREKTFVITLYESGTRVGELRRPHLRDVTRDDHGGSLLDVDGETGKATVPQLEASVPALGGWLRSHSARDDPDATLRCGIQATDRRLAAPIDYASKTKVLPLAAKCAVISKRIHAHLFRRNWAIAVAQNRGCRPRSSKVFSLDAGVEDKRGLRAPLGEGS